MTATETIPAPKTVKTLPAWRKAILFGSGFGIAVGARDLDASLVRLRPAGATLLAETMIADFRSTPAAQWGGELQRFLSAAGQSRLAATVLLPREEVIVRTLNLPGVADKDVPGAIELQLETLHPWDREEVAWDWSRAGESTILLGVVRKSVLDSYETLFSEAGLALAAITFSPAVIYQALRMWSDAPGPLLCFSGGQARTEVYGESAGRAVYSAGFSTDRERALTVSRAELRLAPDYAAQKLADALPKPAGDATPTFVMAWAAGLAGARSHGGKFANLLAPERRSSHDRIQYILPGILGLVLLLALVVAFGVVPAIEERRYQQELNQAIRSLEPAALRVQNLEKRIGVDRSRIMALDDLRRRPQADLDILNELTRLLPPPVWTSAVEIFPDSVVISGEADQAAPLLKILDSSPFFQNSEFQSSVTRNKDSEVFRIKTIRRGRAGRTTP